MLPDLIASQDGKEQACLLGVFHQLFLQNAEECHFIQYQLSKMKQVKTLVVKTILGAAGGSSLPSCKRL